MKILQYPNKVLTKPCHRVTVFDNNLHRLVNDMFKTMKDNSGVGLAAPQVGVLKQVIVISCPGEDPLYMVNPIVTYSACDVLQQEGCLSIDNGKTFYEIERPGYAVVKYQDVKGRFFEYRTFTMNDLLTRAILHEIDHCAGISLLWDKIKSN